MRGFSPNSKTISQRYVEELIYRARKKFSIPGISVAVINSKTVYIHTVQGITSINSNEKIRREDYFHIGSCAKSVLAMLAGKLVEEGSISWDSKLFDLFDELKEDSNPAYHGITLEDLLACEAGIKPFITAEELFPRVEANAANKRYEFAKWLLLQPVSSKAAAPGKFEHLYSNAGYTLAALMLERVSGSSWEDLIMRMMKELGLNIRFGFPAKSGPGQPWGHGYFTYDGTSGLAHESKTLVPFSPDSSYGLNDLIAPAGDLSMPAGDYVKYTQLHLQGLIGIANYLQPATWERIHFSRQGFSLGAGNSVYYNKQITGFDGSAGTFYCRSVLIPGDNVAFIIQTNTGSQKAVDWMTIKITKKYYGWWWKCWM